MQLRASDAVFAGSLPKLYDTLLVPMIFEPYAEDLANRLAAIGPSRVLETAAGTGVVTRAISRALGPAVGLVATDLNQPMLDRAAATGTAGPVEWKQADALQLPFDDASFDAVVCQFGVMFFPDKPRGFAEARRVLRPGGTLLFNAWDRIEENEFANVADMTLAALYPANPPRFLARTPHGYFDRDQMSSDLAGGGFLTAPCFVRLEKRSRAGSAQFAAIAHCQGTPLRHEIEARAQAGGASLAAATAACAAAFAKRFGSGQIEGKIQAQVVSVQRS